jgi:hypothetical protein
MTFRRLGKAEVTSALAAEARRLLALHHVAPYGSE